MISFEHEDVKMPAIDLAKVSRWLTAVAEGYNRRIGEVAYKFCSDKIILETNREFLKHDYYTDIITFDYTVEDRIGGDIFISLDTVKENAEDYHVPYEEELLRVIVHGVLHLCGLKDKLASEREEMEAAENKALEQYNEI